MRYLLIILILSSILTSTYAEVVGERHPRSKEDEALMTDEHKKTYCGDPPDKECVDNMYTFRPEKNGDWETVEWGGNVCGQPANLICQKNKDRIDAQFNEGKKLSYRAEYSQKLKLNEKLNQVVLKKLSKDDDDFVGCSEWGYYDTYIKSSIKTKSSLLEQDKCWKINEGQIVSLKECDPKYEICKFSPGLFKYSFWTWIYNAEPKK